MEKKKVIKIVVGSIIVGVVALFLGVPLLYSLLIPKGYAYYYPENYRGWTCVYHQDPTALPLLEENGYLVIKIPPNGIVRTSSELRTSPRKDKTYYYNGDSVRPAKELRYGSGSTIQEGSIISSQQKGGIILSHGWVRTAEREVEDKALVRGTELYDEYPCGPFQETKEE